ncbi:MAG TPA: glutamine synthetase family protein [Bryobacteraceae bacterium]|nr:glutamine synthetase family protein [Bryobacteraceae bacterium]
MTLAEVLDKFQEHSIQRVKLGAFDIDGVLRGKYISVEKFESAAEGGMGFCDVVFGWDIGDVLYDNAAVTGWHTGYPDAHARIDLSTFRLIPWEPGTAFFLLDIHLDMSPRRVLQRVIEMAKAQGYRACFAAEYEFWMFRETPQSLREKGFRNLTPLSHGMFGYSILRASQHAPLVLGLIEQLKSFDVPLEGFHTETGPGVYEAAIAVDHALAAADKAALFKSAVKEISTRHGAIPTFMAKWSAELPGSSGHLHQSLWRGSENAFFDREQRMSPPMKSYIAGLVRHMPEFQVMFCPTINSYKRTVIGAWAPVNATWGIDNRTTAVRAIPGSEKSTRVELRLSGADMNPYLAMAAALAAGLDGIENKLEPGEPVTNAYGAKDAPALARNLREATDRFRSSETARKWFGDVFVDHFAATRDWEMRQFEKCVTDWELTRYLESI